jgi:hypothetical protein
MGKPNGLLVLEYNRRGYWTVAATADALMRPTTTIYSWIRRRQLKRTLRIGGNLFVRYADAAKLAGGVP